MDWKALTTGPAALAVLLTLGNAYKPPVVDDTAYLLFARHLSQHPLDPYGWELNWYRRPEPAMDILLPPVLPYYLAAGIRVVGEEPTLLKLWLFPVFYLLTRSAWALFARFATSWERAGTALVALGPAVLPLANFMLDVPAAALGLAAVTAFTGNRWLLAGVLAGLAMQTKYTALTLPVVFAVYSLTRWRVLPAVGAGAVALGVFAGWELLLVARYGESHFVVQLRQSGGSLAEKWHVATTLVRPLAAQMGGVAVAWGLLAASAVGVGRKWLLGIMTLHAVGLSVLILSPVGSSFQPGPLFLPAGYGVLLALTAAGASRVGSADGRFLVGWVVVELLGYFALTPFPACRRVIPVTLAAGFLAARAAGPTGPRQVVAFGVACGVGLLALDCWDARVEPAGVAAASEIIGDPGPQAVWTQGHWGWQYAADRRGWKLAVPGETRFAAGDFLVLPAEPDAAGFYRPYHGGAKLAVAPDALQPLGEWVWRDCLAAQTVPNLYGGIWPVDRRTHPRLRVQVFRVLRPVTASTPGTD